MSRLYSLEELVPPYTPPPPRREYERYHPISEHDTAQTLTISLDLLTQALNGDPIWCTVKADRVSDKTYKPIKYDRAVASVANNETLYMPWLTFSEGRTRIMDGRHQLYALLDAGYTHVSVKVDPENLPMISTLVEVKTLYSV